MHHGQRNAEDARSSIPKGNRIAARRALPFVYLAAITLSVVFFFSCDAPTRDVLSEVGQTRLHLKTCVEENADLSHTIEDLKDTIDRQARQIEADEDYETDLRERLYEQEQARYEAESDASAWERSFETCNDARNTLAEECR